MAGRVRVRQIDDDEGNRLMRIVRRGRGSVVTWRRAQMVLWSAQGMSVPQIAGLAFTSEDRVRVVLHNFNADGFDSLYPRYAGGRPPVFTLAQRREIKEIASPSLPSTGCRFPGGAWPSSPISWWPKGWSRISPHEGLREVLRAERVSFQAVRPGSHQPIRSMRRAGPGRRQDVRARERHTDAGPVPAISAGTCAACTRRRCGSRSSATTTPLLPAPDHQEGHAGRGLGNGE